MQKIIFIHLLNDYSGSPKVLSQVISACRKAGRQVEVLTSGGGGFLSQFKPSIISYKWSSKKLATLGSFICAQIKIFFKILSYRKQNIMVYINTMLPFGAAVAAKLTSKPIIYHIHETSFKSKFLKHFLRFIIEKTARKIIFVSNSLKQAELFHGVEQAVVYNALPNDLLNAAGCHEYEWTEQRAFNVLMICSLKYYKGINEFIAIAKQLEARKKISFTLVLNATQDDIQSFFTAVNLPENIHLVSQQQEIDLFYKKAGLLLNLSKIDEWVETFGLTILEAMAFGVPVIVPPVGGPAEIVRDGVEGFLISSYETKKIAEKIYELSTNSELCLSLSKNARKRSADFRQDRFDQRILEVISE